MAEHIRGNITGFMESLANWLAAQTGLVFGGDGDVSGNIYLHSLPDTENGQDNVSSISCVQINQAGWDITDRVRIAIQTRGKAYEINSAFNTSEQIYGAFVDADTKSIMRKISLEGGGGGGGGGWIMVDLQIMRPQFSYYDSNKRPIVTINLDAAIGL